MPLGPGVRVGSYEITGPIGAGGMGVVYRARDTKLQRDAAVKVLPDVLSTDPDRLNRFTREAQTLALLNHPNIAQIYGLLDLPSDIGGSAGSALAMEFIDGEDLASRIARAPMAVDEAIRIARQIASALAAAHDQGIVHRDLKPANVKLRTDGAVKVLDFGLAKISADQTALGLEAAPTLTSPAVLGHAVGAVTNVGVILGTAAYMAPEQVRGSAIDRRIDVWAFGCVLYEMLTQRRAFPGDSLADVFAAIVSREPDWTALPADAPVEVRRLLHWCLRADRAERLRDMNDVALLLGDSGTSLRQAIPVRNTPKRAWKIAAVAGWIAALAGAAVAIGFRGRPAAEHPAPMRLQLPLGTPIDTDEQEFSANFALSPDGTRLVYVGRQGDSTTLYLQDLSGGELRRLPDTAGAEGPFFSPDGGSVAFTSGNKLRTLRLDSPLARDVAELKRNTNARISGAWMESGALLFAESRGLVRVGREGGPGELVAPLKDGEAAFLRPQILPGERAVIAAVRKTGATATDDRSQIAVLDLRSGEHRVIVPEGASPTFVAAAPGSTDGFVVYSDGERLWAVPFDAAALAVRGPAQPVLDNVEVRPNGDGAQFSVSSTGTLAFAPGIQTQLVWVDRSGTATPAASALKRFAMPRVSPDGRTIAVEVQDAPHQTWLMDPERDVLTPLTNLPGGVHDFAWSPDGRGIAATVRDGGRMKIMWVPADGSAEPTVLFSSAEGRESWVNAWSPDGSLLAANLMSEQDVRLVLLPITPGSPPRVAGDPRVVLVQTGTRTSASFSPDSQWLAYCDCRKDESSSTVYVTRLSDRARFAVSTAGGSEPLWSRSGREILFRRGAAMMSAEIALGQTPIISRPRTIFEGRFYAWGTANYDAAGDAQRFIMVRPVDPEIGRRTLNIRLHWPEELKKLW